MNKILTLSFITLILLAACVVPEYQIGPSEQELAGVYEEIPVIEQNITIHEQTEEIIPEETNPFPDII